MKRGVIISDSSGNAKDYASPKGYEVSKPYTSEAVNPFTSKEYDGFVIDAVNDMELNDYMNSELGFPKAKGESEQDMIKDMESQA